MMVPTLTTSGLTSSQPPIELIANNNENGDARDPETKLQKIVTSPQPALLTTTLTSLFNKIMINRAQQSNSKDNMRVQT